MLTIRGLLLSLPILMLSLGCANRTRAVRPSAPVLAAPPELPSPAAAQPEVTTASEIEKLAVAVLGEGALGHGEAADDEFSWDLDVTSYESLERVRFFVNTFAVEGSARTESWLRAGSQFEPLIRGRLRDAGLPEDLYFLAMIESGFSPDAYSRAAAVGIWQFMTATAKGEGLKVDWWVDERRDPVRSTDAAVKHLTGLKRRFGSHYLAAAAYNGGSGRVSRGLAQYASRLEGAEGEDVFFALAETNYLRQETRDYVPKLIAAALVGKYPQRYGLSFDSLPPFTYDSVLVDPATPLAAVASAAGVEIAEVVSHNPQILRGVTHPKESIWVRLPQGTALAFAANARGLSEADLTPFSRAASKRGETFTAVAKRVGITRKQLAWYNPRDGASSRTLPTGTTILVPSAAVLRGARDVPDPAIEIYGGAASYTVKRGDTLGGIAIKYGTTVATLRRLNGLPGDMIKAGQTLRVR